MPTYAAKDRERAAVDRVIAAMRSSSPASLSVRLEGSPETESGSGRWPDPLTVDAVVSLEACGQHELWAVDVMTLTWHKDIGPAANAMYGWLRPRLEALAAQFGRGVLVSFRPPVAAADKGRAYAEAICARVRALLSGPPLPPSPLELDPDTHIEILSSSLTASDTRVSIWNSLTLESDVRKELSYTLVPPLAKKLEGQLRRAHECGFPTILIIDTVGAPQLFGGGDWTASSTSVAQTVGATVAKTGHATGLHVLDFCVMIKSDESCSPVYGYWPQHPNP